MTPKQIRQQANRPWTQEEADREALKAMAEVRRIGEQRRAAKEAKKAKKST